MMTEQSFSVLLLEDDPSLRGMLKTFMEIDGFQVLTIPDKFDLNEIITIIKTKRPNIIFMDVHLNNLDGVEILRKVRNDVNLVGVKVIMASGLDMRRECIAAGANDFLLKPYMPDEIINALRKKLQ